MAQLSEYPNTRELLIELLKLEPANSELPLPVLINLHRVQLRAPLLKVAFTFETLPVSGEEILTQRYPQVRARELFDHREVQEPLERFYDEQEIKSADEGISALIDRSIEKWVNYYPATFLYHLACPGTNLTLTLDVLEVMLDASPVVGAMLLDLAG